MRRTALSVLLAAFALCALSGVQAKDVKLEYKFRKGEVDKYKVTMGMKMSMPGMPKGAQMPGTMIVSMTMAQKVLDVLPDGSAKIQVTMSNMKMSGPGMPRNMGSMPARTMTVTMTKDGRTAGGGMGGMMGGMGAMPGSDPMGSMACVLPTRAVRVGETWKQAIPMPNNCGKINCVSTLLSAALPMGKTTASKIKQSFSGRLDLGKMMGGGAGGGSGDMDLKGSSIIFFSPSQGKLLKTSSKVSVKMRMSTPPNPQSPGAPTKMNMLMDMTINVTKVK